MLSILILFVLPLTTASSIKNFSLRMPNVNSDKNEPYLCSSVKIINNKNFYLVGFEPLAQPNAVHHILLFGCFKPGSSSQFWECDNTAIPCKGNLNQSVIIYSTVPNAKLYQLPKNVGFKIGKDTEVQFLVLQIHYCKKFKKSESDTAGLNILYTKKTQNKLAGNLILAVTKGFIPKFSITKLECSCQINENKTIFPFAFRTHTHELGKVVSGYKIRKNKYGVNHWFLLGESKPNQAIQTFYPVFDMESVKMGDIVKASCTMDGRNKSEDTFIGSQHDNEMCNFYLMYYVSERKTLNLRYCVSEDPPRLYFNNKKI